jgi:plasmid stabilization system protein ParE
MAKKKISVAWTVSAQRQFKEILEYLNERSPVGAAIVYDGVNSIINQLIEHPEKFPPDLLNDAQDKSFRAFTIYSYRITYQITSKAILIYRVRHSGREPLTY